MELGGVEKTLALILGIFRNMPTWVRPIWPKVPHLRQVERLRQELQASVRLILAPVPKIMIDDA